MIDRSQFLTEKRLAESMNLDAMNALQIVSLMNDQDRAAAMAVERVKHDVAQAVEITVQRLMQGGRLIYVGAGTSGRLGVLDASECPPTFQSNPSQVIGIIAGGEPAMFKAQEGAEDNALDGARQLVYRNVTKLDVVCGIAAGGTTPFVHGALAEAKTRGAATIFITCVERFENEPVYDVTIRPLTGPEVLTGSTRLKAGTATKLILNQISTASMVLLGKCYENLMVDLRATNAKLKDRSARIVATICDVSKEEATRVLESANGNLKVAILMHRLKITEPDALIKLEKSGKMLRAALDEEC